MTLHHLASTPSPVETLTAGIGPVKYKIVGAFGALLGVEAGVMILQKLRGKFLAFLATKKPGHQYTLF